MDLVQFKSIFWWEYIHRTLGRFVGLVFIFPFAFFILRKWLDLNLIRKCLVMFSLGALQGFFGWYMVKSGLVNDPHVSHYRLAMTCGIELGGMKMRVSTAFGSYQNYYSG